MRSLPPLNALRAFEAAARHRSFTRAAAELHVTQAAISHQVKALEERIGVDLFRRSPRSLALTPEGEALLPDLQGAFDRMALAVDRIGKISGSRSLNVSLVTTFALTWLVPRLHRFQERHPDIEVRMITQQRFVDLDRDDVDVAVRFTAEPDPALHSVRLFNDRLTPLCGRRYRDRVKSFDDLRRVPLIDTAFKPEWPVWLKAMGLDFQPKRALQFDSTAICVEAAIEGAGVAIGPPDLFRPEFEAGKLFQPFEQLVESGQSWWLVSTSAMAERRKVKAFRDWMVDEVAREQKVVASLKKSRKAAA